MFVIITLSFFIIRLAPGSPFSDEKALPPRVLQDLKAKYGFDKPIGVQYVNYFANLLKGDMGLSTKYPQRSVNEIIADGFPVTLTLAVRCARLGIVTRCDGGHHWRSATKYDLGLWCDDLGDAGNQHPNFRSRSVVDSALCAFDVRPFRQRDGAAGDISSSLRSHLGRYEPPISRD